MERVAFNALPAALTADMWGHNYLSTPNEITAERSPERVFGDNENATVYGLADQFTHVTPCCTANHNQGWQVTNLTYYPAGIVQNASLIVERCRGCAPRSANKLAAAWQGLHHSVHALARVSW